MAQTPDNSRRDFVKRTLYVAPGIVSLTATPSFAKAGSEKPGRVGDGESQGRSEPGRPYKSDKSDGVPSSTSSDSGRGRNAAGGERRDVAKRGDGTPPDGNSGDNGRHRALGHDRDRNRDAKSKGDDGEQNDNKAKGLRRHDGDDDQAKDEEQDDDRNNKAVRVTDPDG